jgi:hypothetical protein
VLVVLAGSTTSHQIPEPLKLLENLTQTQAYQYYRCGVQYIVRDGAVVIVDESTGRVRPISRYSGGLHQAIEAKEGVDVKPDSHATASITFQVFFRCVRGCACAGLRAGAAEDSSSTERASARWTPSGGRPERPPPLLLARPILAQPPQVLPEAVRHDGHGQVSSG